MKPGNKKAMGKNTLASWVKQTILKAYEGYPPEKLTTMKVSSHEVRALATSMAFYGNTAMTEIMKAARWAQLTTFTTFYLRDVAQNMEGIYQLGPLVVAKNLCKCDLYVCVCVCVPMSSCKSCMYFGTTLYPKN